MSRTRRSILITLTILTATVWQVPGARAQLVDGDLTDADERLENGSPYHIYNFDGVVGQSIRVRLDADFEPVVVFVSPSQQAYRYDEVATSMEIDLETGDPVPGGKTGYALEIDHGVDEVGPWHVLVTTRDPEVRGAYVAGISFWQALVPEGEEDAVNWPEAGPETGS